jgi:hypothetical protein
MYELYGCRRIRFPAVRELHTCTSEPHRSDGTQTTATLQPNVAPRTRSIRRQVAIWSTPRHVPAFLRLGAGWQDVGMATYTVTDAAGRRIDDVGPDRLLQFLQQCSDYAVLTRNDWAGRSALARPQDSGWQIEITDDQLHVGWVPNTDAALDVLRSWAEDDDWWQHAFTWRQEDLSPQQEE